MIIWKLLVDGGGISFWIREDKNLLRAIFLVGEMSKFLAFGWVFRPIPRVSHKVLGEERKSTNKTEGGEHFWLERGYMCIILADNSAGHCFILKDLVPRSFSNKL